MKVLVFLLVLGNLLFYAFNNGYFGRPDNPDNPDAGRVEQQIAPERMRIVSRGEAPAVASAKPTAPPEPAPVAVVEEAPDKPPEPKAEPAREAVAAEAVAESTCLLWRQLSVADADRVSTVLGKRFADYKLSRRTVVAESNGWWVFVPPLASKADAEKKAGELRDLGVADFFIVQEGPSRLGISLGVFSTEKGAKDRLAELKGKGVRSAVAGPRPGKDDTVVLQARGPAAAKVAVIGAVGEIAPKSEAQACK